MLAFGINVDSANMPDCRYIKQLMVEAGLKIRVDAVGNTYGLWEGSDPSLGIFKLTLHAPRAFGVPRRPLEAAYCILLQSAALPRHPFKLKNVIKF